MNVGNLIEKLKEYPPEMEVLVFPDGVKGDYMLASDVREVGAIDHRDLDDKDKFTFWYCDVDTMYMSCYVYIGV